MHLDNCLIHFSHTNNILDLQNFFSRFFFKVLHHSFHKVKFNEKEIKAIYCQSKEVDATVDSIVHGFYSINVLHVAHKEKKDHNLWPITEGIPKPMNTQKWGTYANFLNSSNDIFASHDGKTISIEDDLNEADFNKDSPKTLNNHNGNHSLSTYFTL